MYTQTQGVKLAAAKSQMLVKCARAVLDLCFIQQWQSIAMLIKLEHSITIGLVEKNGTFHTKNAANTPKWSVWCYPTSVRLSLCPTLSLCCLGT